MNDRRKTGPTPRRETARRAALEQRRLAEQAKAAEEEARRAEEREGALQAVRAFFDSEAATCACARWIQDVSGS